MTDKKIKGKQREETLTDLSKHIGATLKKDECLGEEAAFCLVGTAMNSPVGKPMGELAISSNITDMGKIQLLEITIRVLKNKINKEAFKA